MKLTNQKQSEIDQIKQAVKNAEKKHTSIENKVIVFADFIGIVAASLLVFILISVLLYFFYQSFPSTMIPEGWGSSFNSLPVPKINNIFIFIIGVLAILIIFLGNWSGLTIKSIFSKSKSKVSNFIKNKFGIGDEE